MQLKKPKFWDYKKPNYLAYLLLIFTFPLLINNYLLNKKKKKKNKEKKEIKNICVGNIYVGGTGKTPLAIKIDSIFKNLNFKTCTIKKYYKNHHDEQMLLKEKTKLYCYKSRKLALTKAINDNIEVAIFDDGLQDPSIDFDLRLVCFNKNAWIGNGFLIPAGPLREKINCIAKYDAIFLNGNEENTSEIRDIIKKYGKDLLIFETTYRALNINEFSQNKKYVMFSGIGNSEGFKKTLLKNKLDIIHEVNFPDHYSYNYKDINKIKLCAKKLNANIVTTEKDYIKLDSSMRNQVQFLKIDLVIKNEEMFLNLIKSKI